MKGDAGSAKLEPDGKSLLGELTENGAPSSPEGAAVNVVGRGIAAAPDCSIASAMLLRMSSTVPPSSNLEAQNDPSRLSTKKGNVLLV
jgi:hypothetical protein